ncbi:MAG: Tautomerase enzyme [Clostridia bacterium]|nr:Tautomerase enzyme [Clostridia bacterium]
MPTIRIDLIEGRTLEQKRELVKGITEVVLRRSIFPIQS